mmetsp:Transcript_23361/g.51270  ORF Transcript_23361/g.51270 Transcript_23361/m.51270 type:complete len:231 (+) Transcript_23361:1163-1855(+)
MLPYATVSLGTQRVRLSRPVRGRDVLLSTPSTVKPRRASSSCHMVMSMCAAVCWFISERHSCTKLCDRWFSSMSASTERMVGLCDRWFSSMSASTERMVGLCPLLPRSSRLSSASMPSSTRKRARFLRSGTTQHHTASRTATAKGEGRVGSALMSRCSWSNSTATPWALRRRRRFSALTVHSRESSIRAKWRTPSGWPPAEPGELTSCTMSSRTGTRPSAPKDSARSGTS